MSVCSLSKKVITLYCALVAGHASAERRLSLKEAIERARAANRDLQIGRSQVEEAAVAIERARVALLPTVAVQGKYTHNYKEVTLDLAQLNQGVLGLAAAVAVDPTSQRQADAISSFQQQLTEQSQNPIIIQRGDQLDGALSVTVPLLVPSAYPALNAARKSIKAAKANYQVSEASLLFAVAQSFYAAAGTDELVAARKHAIEVAGETLKNAQSRFAAGMVNRVEVMRAELALVRAEQSLTEAEDARAQSYRALSTMIQLREPFSVSPTEPTENTRRTKNLVQQALELRPEFTATQLTIAAAGAQKRAGAWAWAPTLSAFGNARVFNYGGFAGDQYAWAVGLQLDWLLYDGGLRDAQRHQAAAQERTQKLRFEQLVDAVSDEVKNATQALSTKQKALTAARQSVDLSKETLTLVRAQYDAGTATQLDLLQSQDALVNSEVGVAQARFDLAISDLSLARVTGTFPSRKQSDQP
jgi:outer membrane protein TolC